MHTLYSRLFYHSKRTKLNIGPTFASKKPNMKAGMIRKDF